jgi:hypothetical protein
MVGDRALSPAHRVAVRLQALDPHEPCGDAALQLALPAGAGAGSLLAIIDGLGHGRPAAAAAQAAMRVLQGLEALSSPAFAGLPALLRRLDSELSGTRGAAIGLLQLDGARLRHAGVGNTRALRWRGGQLLRLSSQYGIVGGGLAGPVQVTETDLLAGDWLLLFTDGLDEAVTLPMLLPEWQRDPGLLCEYLLARWRSAQADDAGVLVCCVAHTEQAAAGPTGA